MEMKIKELELSSKDFKYIDSVIGVLSIEMTKADMILHIKPIIESFKKVPINGLIRDIITDLECHLNLYESNTNDYKFRADSFTFSKGIDRFIEVLKLVQQNKDFEVPENIYKIYQRWIHFDDKKIEVELLFMDYWNYEIFKDFKKDDYYFSIMFDGIASYNKVFKVNTSDKESIIAMIKANNKDDLNQLVNAIRLKN